MTSGDQTGEGECRHSESAKDCLDTEDDNPTPKLSAEEPDCVPVIGSLLPPGAVSRPVDEPVDMGACQTPVKRLREAVRLSPGSDEVNHVADTKRIKEKREARPVPSYTDPDVIDGDPDLDGEPLEGIQVPPLEVPKRSSVISVSSSRMLIRRATDFPFPPPSEADLYAPSPRSATIILENVFGVTCRESVDALSIWRQRREEFKCPLCLDVLVRPVDVAGCGHFVCRTHVLDVYQHGGCREGIRCCVCRREEKVEDFDKIQVDKNMWSKIQRAKFHSARRKSVSPSRSLTPLRERFNRKFLQDVDF